MLDEEDQFGRKFCRQMVEDSWRAFLSYAAAGSRELGVATIARLDERSREISRSLEPALGQRFLATIEEERGKIFDEYTTNPAALKQRLGVAVPVPSAALAAHGQSRQDLGELVVRTAIRATIWESIVAIFRSSR